MLENGQAIMILFPAAAPAMQLKLDKQCHAEVVYCTSGAVYICIYEDTSISSKPLYHWQGKLVMTCPDMEGWRLQSAASSSDPGTPGADCLHPRLSECVVQFPP